MFQKVQEYCTARGFETRRPSFPCVHSLILSAMYTDVTSWSSVARGAVARGMEAVGNNPVRLRLCRRHYGVRVLQRWDPSIHHHSDDIYTHEVTNEKMAAGKSGNSRYLANSSANRLLQAKCDGSSEKFAPIRFPKSGKCTNFLRPGRFSQYYRPKTSDHRILPQIRAGRSPDFRRPIGCL